MLALCVRVTVRKQVSDRWLFFVLANAFTWQFICFLINRWVIQITSVIWD